jgi:hypothetical protein
VPVHDWTLVEDGVFHDFHTVWIAEIRSALNANLLPKGYYALAEQHTGYGIADILTLHADPVEPRALPSLPPEAETGGTAIAQAPPRVRRRRSIEPTSRELRRSIAIRHVSGHRLVAMLEIIFPGNKDRAQSAFDFATKGTDSLHSAVHLLIVDLFPPGPTDPEGMHAIIHQRLENSELHYDLPAAEPLILVSYQAGPRIEAFIEHLKVGDALPDMPLFFRHDRYIDVPLEATYQAAWRGMPAFWRDVLEGHPPKTY